MSKTEKEMSPRATKHAFITLICLLLGVIGITISMFKDDSLGLLVCFFFLLGFQGGGSIMICHEELHEE